MKNQGKDVIINNPKLDGPRTWISKFKDQSHADLKEEGMPSRNSEYWRFSSPKLWESNGDFLNNAEPLPKNDNGYSSKKPEFYINFFDGVVDGVSLKKLNNQLNGCEIFDFKECASDDCHWVSQYLGKAELKARTPYKRPFALLNGSSDFQGLVFNCKQSPKKPIHIFYFGDREIDITLRHLLKVANDAELNIIEHFSGPGKVNVVLEGFLDTNAILNHNRLVNSCVINSVITHFFINCMTSASVKTVSINLGDSAVRNETYLSLDGSGCMATVAGIGVGYSSRSICDNTVFISHLEKASKSRQIIKNVLSKGATAVFQGKIFVDSKAQKTDGYQMSNGLLLDDSSEFLVKPELEIYADDVVCSHGSTSGSIDKEYLFYLQSRGISEREAKRILIQAYLEEVIEEIEDPEFAKILREEIHKILV